MHAYSAGLLYAASAQTLWGFFPLFWKLLDGVPALEVLAHRGIWAAVGLWLLLAWRGELAAVWRLCAQARVFWGLLASSLLIASNWGIFIYAVQIGDVLSSSLGYFLAPLLSVLVGAVVFKERLRPWQWVAVALAAVGVTTQIVGQAPPWLALGMALTFVLYGLLRKIIPASALHGLSLETLLLLPLAVGFVLWRPGTFAQDWQSSGLLIAGGLVTLLPLLLFGAGARRLPLSTVGMMIYITPSIQFLLGWWVFSEPVSMAQWGCFACIWLGLVIYTMDSKLRARPA